MFDRRCCQTIGRLTSSCTPHSVLEDRRQILPTLQEPPSVVIGQPNMGSVGEADFAAMNSQFDYDVLIIGAGLSGIYSLYRMRQLGLRTRVLEAGTGEGGTWYW